MTLETTRRSLLATIPAAAVVAAIPATAAGIPTNRSTWGDAMRLYQQAKSEDGAFMSYFNQVHDAWEAGRPSLGAIRWKELSFGERNHTARVLDLDKAWRQFLSGEGKTWWSKDPEATKARFRAALDSVQEFRDAEAKHERESGMAEADARSEALSERLGRATDALMAMPAPDLAALRWKLDYLTDDGDGWPAWSAEFVEQVNADMARLLPQGR